MILLACLVCNKFITELKLSGASKELCYDSDVSWLALPALMIREAKETLMRSTHSPHLALILVIVLASMVVACGGSTTSQLAESRPTTAAADNAAESSVTESPAATEAPAPTEAPTTPPEPTAVPLVDPIVQASGFAQDGQSLGFGVVIENPNEAASLEDVSLQVVAYGEGDLVLGTDESTIPMLPPAATIHFGGDMYLDAEQTVNRVEVQITDLGERQDATADEIPPFAVENARFTESQFGQNVSGIVKNPFTLPLTDLYIGIVGLNDAGEVVGGGFTFLSFLDAEGTGAFDTSVKMREAPARVEVSPLVSILTLFGQRDAEEMPVLTLDEQGWSMDSSGVGYGVIVSNPDTEQAMEGAQYRATAYAEDGSVLSTDTGYFGLILPGGKGARGSSIYLGSDAPAPATVEVQVFPGRLTDAPDTLAWATEAVNYVPGSYGAKATGQLINPYDEQVKNVEIVAILRDGEGKIIGGGFMFTDTIPAKGKVAVEMSVSGGEAASVELFPAEVSLTSIGAD